MIVRIHAGEIANKAAVRKFFAALTDGSYFLTATETTKRNLDQNGYYWIAMEYVLQGLKDAGFEGVHTKKDAHKVCKSLFLKSHVTNPSTGEAIETIGSSKELTKAQFSEYLEKIIHWAAEYLNTIIPAPNSQQNMFK